MLDKSIKSGREHRHQYYKATEIVSRACRPGGGDVDSLNNRRHKTRRLDEKFRFEMKEYSKAE